MFSVSTRVIIIAVAFVEGCGWYVAEWRDHADRGQRTKLVRNPLGMVARACSRLWTNRRMVWLLVALWVVHLAVLHMLVGVRAKSVHNRIFSAVVPRQAAFRLPPRSLQPNFLLVMPDDIEPARTLSARFPRIIHLGLCSPGWPANTLALGLFACVMLYAGIRRPEWLRDELRQRIRLPTLLTLAAFLVLVAWGVATYRETHRHPMPIYSGTLSMLLTLLWLLLEAAFVAFVWHLIYQIGAGKRWDVRRAMVVAADAWPAVAMLLMVLCLPAPLLRLIPNEVAHPVTVNKLARTLPIVLSFAFVFVPWLIVGGGLSLPAALLANFRVLLRHWRDVGAFCAFYSVTVVPLIWLILAIAGGISAVAPALQIGELVGELVDVVILLTVAGTYMELYPEDKRAPEACVT